MTAVRWSRSLRTRGVVRCGLAAVLFGGVTPLAARIATESGAPALAGLLYVGAALGVVPFAIRSRVEYHALRRAARPLAASVLVGGLVAPLLLAAGLARTSGATASLLLNLELVATTVFAASFFHEHLGRRVIAGVTLVTAASGLLVWTGAPELRLGALLVVGACIGWGLDNCVTAGLADIPPVVVTLAKGAIAGSTNLAVAVVLHAAFPRVGYVFGALALGAVGYGLSITLWISGARDLGAARGQLIFAAAPFVGVLVAWVALGEPVHAAQLVAVALALIGVTAVSGSEHEHRHRHEPVVHDHEHSHDDGHHDHDTPGVGPHAHAHEHRAVTHAHPHVPDLHHRHAHEEP